MQSFAQQLPVRLKVGTYNVGHFNQGELGGFQGRHSEAEALKWKAWVGAQALDIFGVQEWNEGFDKDSTMNAAEHILKPYYDHVYLGDRRTWIYNGIATHYKLANIRIKYWAGDYYALMGDLNLGGKTITVISTHIPWQQKWHADALDLFVAELKKHEYFICLGDMNAKDEEQLRFRKEGFNIANGGHQGWFVTAATGKVMNRAENLHIDNILTSRNIKIMNVAAPYTGLNDQDHLPVTADLIITD
ncbi:hypothetical protein GCM10023091_19410 [Ravibacter arvi]|uniref:Endonuclease/exonuclease/phosphatase domain-containing protein n=1 Tax=Ravibacter arvi TaxID=2051041 RepID=A0ABP8LYD1_9BACT